MSTRVNDPKTTGKIVVMQRCREQDLSGHLLEQGGWEHLRLPAEYEEAGTSTSLGWRDPRKEPGELLWPNRFGQTEIAHLKRSLGSHAAAGQLQQRPSPAEGGVIKRHWWRYWQPRGTNLPPAQVRFPDGTLQPVHAVELPVRFEEQIQSWDCAFKDLTSFDYVVGQVWARQGADRFLLDQTRARMDCPATFKAVRDPSAQWPQTHAKLIEGKANGPAVIQMLRHELSGVIPVNPEGGKMARASAVSPQIEAGNICLPHPQTASWVNAFIEECAAFPNAANDDQLDAASQTVLRWTMLRRPVVYHPPVPMISPI